MSQAIVRRAAEHDLPGMLALYRYLHPDDPALAPETAQRIWRDLLGQTSNSIFVIDGAGNLASTCTLTIIASLTRGGRAYAIIENVVTHPDCRQTGLGAAVLAAAIETAWAENCYKISLATGSTRESTLRFYEKAGFLRNGRTFFEIRRDA